jgi:hypothetical protein
VERFLAKFYPCFVITPAALQRCKILKLNTYYGIVGPTGRVADLLNQCNLALCYVNVERDQADERRIRGARPKHSEERSGST